MNQENYSFTPSMQRFSYNNKGRDLEGRLSYKVQKSTHIRWLTSIWNSTSRASKTSEMRAFAHSYTQTYTQN